MRDINSGNPVSCSRNYYDAGAGNTAWISSICYALLDGLGTGFGLMFAPCSTIINFYFKDKRCLANGLIVGCSVWSLMGVIMVDRVGLKNISPGLGLLYLGVGITTCLTHPIAGRIIEKCVEDVAHKKSTGQSSTLSSSNLYNSSHGVDGLFPSGDVHMLHTNLEKKSFLVGEFGKGIPG
ncbi:unnamed protein product [Mytilus coruscus]|uniref:Uncharacterized protein n=1 Tax=Mytilus coruscus TaxID=42192 RepID=A0A6J8E685_MYTCO|nr:unnamed protein product [Mytilus coruscus]